jgi:hypothetical protein
MEALSDRSSTYDSAAAEASFRRHFAVRGKEARASYLAGEGTSLREKARAASCPCIYPIHHKHRRTHRAASLSKPSNACTRPLAHEGTNAVRSHQAQHLRRRSSRVMRGRQFDWLDRSRERKTSKEKALTEDKGVTPLHGGRRRRRPRPRCWVVVGRERDAHIRCSPNGSMEDEASGTRLRSWANFLGPQNSYMPAMFVRSMGQFFGSTDFCVFSSGYSFRSRVWEFGPT